MPDAWGQIRYDDPALPGEAMVVAGMLLRFGTASFCLTGFMTSMNVTVISQAQMERSLVGARPPGLGAAESRWKVQGYNLWARDGASCAWLPSEWPSVPQYLLSKGLGTTLPDSLVMATFIALVNDSLVGSLYADLVPIPTLTSIKEWATEAGRELPAFIEDSDGS